MSKEVIASYSAVKAFPVLAFFGGAYLILSIGWYSPTENIWDHAFRHGPFRAYTLVIGSSVGLLLLPILLRALWQISFGRLRALWIEGDWLVYMNQRFVSIQRANIA